MNLKDCNRRAETKELEQSRAKNNTPLPPAMAASTATTAEKMESLQVHNKD